MGLPRSGLTLVLALASGEAAAQPRPDPIAGLAAYAEQSRAVWHVPGVAVAVVKDDSVVFLRGFGVRAVGSADSVTPETIFAIASVTKTFTGTAIAMLADEGKLGWDDRVTRWLPSFGLYDPYVTREVRLRDLMSHRSGLGQQADLLWYMGGYPRDETLRRIRWLEPNASFRSTVGYSNLMVTAAGQVVGVASGATWDEFVRRRIFEPLGMTRSSTSIRDLAGQTNVAVPHHLVSGRAVPVPFEPTDNIGPAGAVNSTVRDLAAYLRWHLAGGRYQGKQLVGAAALATTKTPQIYIDGMGSTMAGFVAEGLGWVLEEYRGRKVVRHDGGIDGMLSELWTVPEVGLGFVVLTNGEPHFLASSISRWILDSYLGGLSRDWNAEFELIARQNAQQEEADEARIEAARVPDTKPSLPLDRYAGRYHDQVYGDLIVESSGDHLVARFGPFTATVTHWHYDVFRGSWEPGYLAARMFFDFHVDRAGAVASVEVPGLATFTR